MTVVLAAQDLEQSLHPNRPTRKLGEHPASGVRGWHGFMDIGTYVRWLYESLDAVLSAQPWGEVVLSGGRVVIDPADEGPDEIDPKLIAAIETAVVKLVEIIEAEAPSSELAPVDATEWTTEEAATEIPPAPASPADSGSREAGEKLAEIIEAVTVEAPTPVPPAVDASEAAATEGPEVYAITTDRVAGMLIDSGIDVADRKSATAWCKDRGVEAHTREEWCAKYSADPPRAQGNARFYNSADVMKAIDEEHRRAELADQSRSAQHVAIEGEKQRLRAARQHRS